MGKYATRSGVQATKAVYADEGTGHTIDIFAKSEPGQRLIISGTGLSSLSGLDGLQTVGTVTIGNNLWRSSRDADVLLLGDSFANIFSLSLKANF